MRSLYVFFIIALILLIISAVLISIGAGQLNKNPERANDPNLSKAYNLLVAGAIVSWLAVFIGIILFVLILVNVLKKKPEETTFIEDKQNKKALILGLMITCFALAAIDGVLAAVAASSMISSQEFSSKDKTAYNLAVASAVLGFGVVAVIMIILAVYYSSKKSCEQQKLA